MALNIRNTDAERLAAEVARRTGETKTQAVIMALQERLVRIRRERRGTRLADELTEIARQCAELPVRDARSAEAILAYDEDGLPH